MPKILLSFLLIGLLLFCFSQNKLPNIDSLFLNRYEEAEKNYSEAEKLSSQAGDNEELIEKADEQYRRSLTAFTNLLPAAEKKGTDSLLFFIYLKTGYIHYYFDSIAAAKSDYLALISLKERLQALPDSFLFLPYLYTGAIYYTQNQPDSALYFYKKAEQVNDCYQKPLNEAQRLYNRLGATFYESGNYRKAKNYFEKAIALTNPVNNSLVANYKINIASLLVKLENYDSAKSVYEKLLPSDVFENEIYHNLAIINIRQQQYNRGIEYLRKINYTGDKKSIELYYNFGVAYAGLNEKDSSDFYLQKALSENIKWNSHRKNSQLGLILKFQGDQMQKQRLYKEAISRYQEAMMQFHQTFYETETSKNPEQFNGVFSFINLFNTLSAKASAFESLYNQDKNIETLKSSLNAYRSAFKLADYIGKTYDSDEARLFLGKIKHTVHSKPIDICLLLYGLTQNKNYLEYAYLFDQQNKASILALNVQENELRNSAAGSNELFRNQATLKTSITRLLLRAAQANDSIAQLRLNDAIRDKEIELSKLDEKIKADPAWQAVKSIEQIPSIDQLQKRLDNNTALLSFHLSSNELLIFYITPGRFEYHLTTIGNSFFNTIDSFKRALHNTLTNQRYNGNQLSNNLYNILIDPIQSKLLQTKRLIIIPDDELNYLSFEALRDNHNKYLIETFSIQYQFSSALLGKNKTPRKVPGILSFAPFALSGYNDSSGYSFSSLPASKDEIAKLEGVSFIDSSATKNNFLQFINKYGTIHLATHASVNNEDPSHSFIAFHPGNNDYRMYAPEIANLKLDSTQLVILSACETGTGLLVKGEGLMSLSRAFAYAGCPDIITSLWKAEDKTTAYLTKQLHFYLDKSYTKDKALQLAKIDLLNNKYIDPRFKSPVYWAHLILIGEYESRQQPTQWWWIAFFILIASIIYLFVKRKNLPEK
jgi:CHAT domain-containing protein